jgi:hypothetical protein
VAVELPGFVRRAGFWGAVGGAALIWYSLSSESRLPPARRAVLALPGHDAYPDCREHAGGRDHEVLQCWAYGTRGAWRVSSLLSAHGALVIQTLVTDREVADEAAQWAVDRFGDRYGEILLYASVLTPPRPSAPSPSATVTRVRWTPGNGFTRLTFESAR